MKTATILLDLQRRLIRIEALLRKDEQTMSKLSDAIAAAKAAVDKEVTRVQASIDALNAKIAELEAADPTTQADLDAIAALQARVDAFDQALPTAKRSAKHKK